MRRGAKVAMIAAVVLAGGSAVAMAAMPHASRDRDAEGPIIGSGLNVRRHH
jgi:hypothetical protein